MKTDVLIIGGGVTGTGIARDLALRGLKTLLVEKKDIDAGASGGNHGLLHSGARYVSNDAHSAVECMEEGRILKQVAPACIDDCKGLFVAVDGDDETYAGNFPGFCKKAGLNCREISASEALEREPNLSQKTIAAYEVDDASIDPFMLALENISHARQLGSILMCHTEAIDFKVENKRITRVVLKNNETGQTFEVEADQVVNAAGAWAGKIASRVGAHIPIIYSKGTLLVTQSRLTRSVVNRLRPPSDADILVPGGTVSVLGTTSITVDDPDKICPTVQETDLIVKTAAQMIPSLETTRYIRAYSGVRPLVSHGESGGARNVSRSFVLLDHEDCGIENFATITGGKLTTFRLMAEKTSDLVCRRMGYSAPCLTRTEPLPTTVEGKWTEPGSAPRRWMAREGGATDRILCECEMISEQTIDDIGKELFKNGQTPNLLNIGKRSRLGKGACQGAFCSIRVLAHMYERGALDDACGIDDIKAFLNERWKGQHPIFWGDQLMQAELTEAVHCGLFDLECAKNTRLK